MIFLVTYSIVLLLFIGDASAYGADLSGARVAQIDGEWWVICSGICCCS
jgi:hypothetical protein